MYFKWGPMCGVCVIVAMVAGCTPLSRVPIEPPSLPAVIMLGDSVAIEICQLRIPVDGAVLGEPFWAELDETHLPVPLRQRLTANGFRCGLAGIQLPGGLQRLLDGPAKRSDGSDNETVAVETVAIETEAPAVYRRLTCRAGRRNEIVTSEVVETLEVLYQEEGQIRGQSCPGAQCLLAMKTRPRGDGRVELELTPEVHYGRPRHSWTGRDGVFRQEVGRQRKVFDKLRLEVVLSPGETLVLSAGPDTKGLGRGFFWRQSDGQPCQKLLLLRIAQTQRDDLFSPARIATPISTAVE